MFTRSVLQQYAMNVSSPDVMGEAPSYKELILIASEPRHTPFVSYAGIGRVIGQYTPELHPTPSNNILYVNTNTPSATVICGVQGSGKSHSVSVIIENSLIKASELGKLPEKLSVVVFHLGAAQGGMHLPCESAFT